MYYVNKVVGWALSPMGILVIGCFVGLALRRCGARDGRRGLRRLGTALVAVSAGLFWTLSCGVVTRWIGVPLEGEEVSRTDAPDPGGCDAIVLLGGGMGAHEKCGRAEMFSGADRVWEAARQWKACRNGRVKLALSGEGVERSTVPLLKDLGVDEKALVFFPEARNTEEEARMVAASGVRRVRLVTSAWHMPRARRLFERAGLDVQPAPTDYEMHFCAESPLRFGEFLPSADALWRNGMAVKEWVARFGYWALGK